MKLDRVDVATFVEVALPLLLEDEARHNLMIGLALTLRDDSTLYPEHKLWVVRDGGKVVAAALRTPPHSLVVAKPRSDSALALLAQLDDDPPGVTGALPEAEAFAALRPEAAEPLRSMRLFQLDRVRPVPEPPGAYRDATADDLDVLLDWWRAFHDEAVGGPASPERMRTMVEFRLTSETEGIVLWDDGEPAALASFGGQTPGGVRIGPVYTPPDRRGRGYATALTAELSRRLLGEGRRFCFLYTDAANPTANAIYERIGYEFVCDSAELAFRT